MKQNKIKSIDFLMPRASQYEVIHAFTKALYRAAVDEGFTCRLLTGEDRISEPLNAPPDLTFCFNGAPVLPNGEWLCDVIKKPHLCWLLDPPYRFWDNTRSENMWIGCDDRLGCKMLNQAHFYRNLFLPHAVDKDYLESPKKERPLDIVFLATYIDAKGRRKKWPEKFNKKEAEALEIASQKLELTPNRSFIELLYETLKENQLHELKEKEAKALFEEFELYTKGFERIQIAKSLMPLGGDIFGGTVDEKTWEEELSCVKGVRIHPEIDFVTALKIMKESKILLNSSLKNQAGAHERIFYGFHAGALVATAENPYLKEILGASLYFFGQEDQTKEDLQKLLNSPQELITRVETAQNLISKQHTWNERLKTIISRIEA